MPTPPKDDTKTSTSDKSEEKTPEAEKSKSETEKPDPARYGDWTVKGIAVDF